MTNPFPKLASTAHSGLVQDQTSRHEQLCNLRGGLQDIAASTLIVQRHSGEAACSDGVDNDKKGHCAEAIECRDILRIATTSFAPSPRWLRTEGSFLRHRQKKKRDARSGRCWRDWDGPHGVGLHSWICQSLYYHQCPGSSHSS